MKEDTMAKMMMFHIPEDNDLLMAYGELSLRHEHLTHILRMTIKTLARLEVSEALDATAYDGATRLRDRIKTLARQRLGEGEALLKLQAILEQCKRATEKRNELIHSVWGKELDGEPFDEEATIVGNHSQLLKNSRHLERKFSGLLNLSMMPDSLAS